MYSINASGLFCQSFIKRFRGSMDVRFLENEAATFCQGEAQPPPPPEEDADSLKAEVL